MIPGCRARPINDGKTDRGASSPANPAVKFAKWEEDTKK